MSAVVGVQVKSAKLVAKTVYHSSCAVTPRDAVQCTLETIELSNNCIIFTDFVLLFWLTVERFLII